MATGRIVTWKGDFGFIRQEQVSGDVYVNVRNMHPELRELATNGRIQGARVQFTVEPVPGRNPRAINVRGFITVPQNLVKVDPPTDETWSGKRRPYIHEAWNTKNPRGSGPASREALESDENEYFRVHFNGHGKYNSRSAAHKSLAGLAAMVDGLFDTSLDNLRASLWVDEVSGIGYVFAPDIPDRITQPVWDEAAAFAGLKNIRVVVAEKFTAYTLVAFKGWLTEKARFEVRRVTGLVYDGVVRFQYKWQKVELPDVPTEFMPASASSLIAAMAACKSDEYQRKRGLEAQALLALFAAWTLDSVKSVPANLQGLIGPEASDAAVVTEAQASLRHLASMTDQDPLANYGVRLETTPSGAKFVVGWIKFKSGREELVPIQSYRSGSGYGRPLHFRLDPSAFGHEVKMVDVYDQDSNKALLAVGHSGWVAKSTDLEAEIVRIQAEEVEKARQARIAKAGQPELRLVGPTDRPFAEVVEYDGQGDETVLTMVGFSCPDRYNYWVKAQREDGSTVEIRIGYDDKVMTNAASRSWQMLQPRCSGCGEIIFQMGPAHARWDTCGTDRCPEERKRRGRK